MTVQSKFLNFLLRPAVLAAVSIAIVASAATAYHFATQPAAPAKVVAPAKAVAQAKTRASVESSTGNTEELVKMAESRRNRDDAEWCALSEEIADDFRGIREQERWGAGGTVANKAAWELIGEKLDRLRKLHSDSEAMTKIITTYK